MPLSLAYTKKIIENKSLYHASEEEILKVVRSLKDRIGDDAFITAFLYLFKTQSEFSFANQLEWLHGLITFGALCFNILLLPRIFPVSMDSSAWTIKKYILLNVFHLILIWAVATVLEKIFFCSLDMTPALVRGDTIAVNLRKKDIGKETESHFEQENQEFFKLSVNYCFR